MSNIKLSKNFYLSEFTKSQTASRYGIDNTPSKEIIDNLKLLCDKVLQPVRDAWGIPVIVSSGYRSVAVNRRVGGDPNSQHLKGQAADFDIAGIDNFILAKWIEKHLNYDQLILEFYEGGNSGWIHVGYSTRHLNKEKTINRWGVFNGLRKY